MELVINLLIYLFSNLILGFVLSVCLTPRFEKVSRFVYIIVFFIFVAGPSAIKFFITEQNLLFEVLYNLAIVFIFVFAFLGFKDKLWKKVFITAFIVIASILAEGMTYNVLDITMDEFLAAAMTSFGILARTIHCGFFLSFLTPVCLLWIRLNNQNTIQKISPWKALPLPISQALMITLISEMYFEEGQNMSSISVYIFVFSLFIEMIFITLISIESEKAMKELQLYELKAHMDQEKELIERLKEDNDKESQLRHDRKNILMLLQALVKEGKMDEAMKVREGIR